MMVSTINAPCKGKTIEDQGGQRKSRKKIWGVHALLQFRKKKAPQNQNFFSFSSDAAPPRLLMVHSFVNYEFGDNVMSRASEIGPPTNHLGSRQRRTDYWTRFTKAG